MNPYDCLYQRRETVPVWLDQFKRGDEFPCTEFFQSRVVYYPGGGSLFTGDAGQGV